MIKKFEGPQVTPLEIIAAKHSQLMNKYPNMYFELAQMRHTDPMAWLTTEDVEDNPKRTVISCQSDDSLIGSLKLLADSGANELPALIELSELFDDLINSKPYAYFFFYAKPKEGWVLKISTHHTVKHKQYKLLVSVTTDNMYDTLNQALEKLKSIKL